MLNVEVAYASQTKQITSKLQVSAGSNIRDVLLQSKIMLQLQLLEPQVFITAATTYTAETTNAAATADTQALPQHPSVEITLENFTVGIFGKQKTLDTAVTDGDRIEIYRPLYLDPKEARRRRAKQQRSKKIVNSNRK